MNPTDTATVYKVCYRPRGRELWRSWAELPEPFSLDYQPEHRTEAPAGTKCIGFDTWLHCAQWLLNQWRGGKFYESVWKCRGENVEPLPYLADLGLIFTRAGADHTLVPVDELIRRFWTNPGHPDLGSRYVTPSPPGTVGASALTLLERCY